MIYAKDTNARAELRQLENEDIWVFHGSGVQINVLEPQQAYNYPHNSDKGKIPDDKPAVFATPSADVAIFMAIMNRANAPQDARCGLTEHSDGSFEFRTTQETMEQINNAVGYVYVLRKEKFVPRSKGELISYKAVSPERVVTVTDKDLPEKIEIKVF